VHGVQQTECIPKLRALADETRWRIVEALLARELTVSDLVESLGVSQYNVSKHLRVLRESGIVVSAKEGKSVRCRVAPDLRARLRKEGRTLDLGCCQFRFGE
jgi:DNA-binding transcriptional ArsR family regulator